MIRGLVTAFEASADILPHRIVAFSSPSTNNKIATATSATGPLVGTTGKVAGPAGQMVDVERTGGVPRVQLGGTVAAGDWLTTNGVGKAIKVTAAGQRTIGQADQPGNADDIINYLGAPGVVGGA